jgi:HTH-type transcriptional regulator/antitoxin HigA
MEVIIAADLTQLSEYRDLLLAIEPRVITSEAQAEVYLRAIDTLTDCPALSDGQCDVIGLLGQLVYDWEEEHEEPITATPTEVIVTLLEANGLRQQALVGPVFPNAQVASACLSGRRTITYDRAVKLGSFFHVSPAVFYAA